MPGLERQIALDHIRAYDIARTYRDAGLLVPFSIWQLIEWTGAYLDDSKRLRARRANALRKVHAVPQKGRRTVLRARRSARAS